MMTKPSLLQVEALQVSFQGDEGAQSVLDGVSLAVAPGKSYNFV